MTGIGAVPEDGACRHPARRQCSGEPHADDIFVQDEGSSWDLVRAIVLEIPMMVPWDLESFVCWAEQVSGRRVDLSPWSSDALTPPRCAALLVLEDALVIRIDGRRSQRHQMQQIMHEFGHVLCDQAKGRFGVGAGSSTCGLDTAQIAGLLQRRSLDCMSEIHAELVGTQLSIMTREVSRFNWIEEPALGEAVRKNGAWHRMRTLWPLWSALVEAVPAVRLNLPEREWSNQFLDHRMRIEIEDAIVALGPVLEPSEAGSPKHWARAIARSLHERAEAATAVTSAGAGCAAVPVIGEGEILEIAKEWRAYDSPSR